METDNFKIIYGILSALDRQMDSPHVKRSTISAEAFDASNARWGKIMLMLTGEGYIQGFSAVWDDNINAWDARTADIAITLKGLEYLREYKQN